MTLSDIKLTNNSSYIEIVAMLQQNGICIIDDFFSVNEVAEAVKTLSSHLSNQMDGCTEIHKHPNNDGRVGRYKFEGLSDNIVKNKFGSQLLRDIALHYYEPYSVSVCTDIFFTHELASKVDILPWHFDRQESLKFYVNLVDVSYDNGALQYDIGSHRQGHLIADNNVMRGVPVGKIPNDVPEEFLRCPKVIEVSAGDLIIFDAAGFHKAGSVNENCSRMVIRAHSHPLPVAEYKAKLFSSHWLSQSVFNCQKFIGKKVQRRATAKLFKNLKLSR